MNSPVFYGLTVDNYRIMTFTAENEIKVYDYEDENTNEGTNKLEL